MKTVPVSAIPAQRFAVVLGGQSCTITIHQKTTGLFLSLYVGSNAIVLNTICRDMVKVVRQSYLGFKGDLVFMDMQGNSDPQYAGLGTRFLLLYIESTA